MQFGHIYVIENMITGEEYVGRTTNLKQRIYNHKSCIANNVDYHLYRNIRKYGEENFCYYKLHKCHVDDLDEMEINYIFEMDTQRNGLNSTEGGKTPVLTEEIINKIKKSREGWKHTEEAKRKVSIGNKGKIRSKEFKELQSKLALARSEEKRKKVFNTYYKYGGKKTQVEIAKILGYSDSSTVSRFMKTDWWKEMEEERKNQCVEAGFCED